MKRFTTLLAGIIIAAGFLSAGNKPKLAVVIILDQFPYEYLERSQPFVTGGFRYLFDHGANFTATSYGHAWTKTAPGHAAIATGAYGHNNGIPANNWYDRASARVMNAVGDTAVRNVPSLRSRQGRSPVNLRMPAIGDMLRQATGFRSRVVSLSNKDRVAILLGGKTGTAFWIDQGKLVTSTYYSDTTAQAFRKLVDTNADLAAPWFGKIWDEINPDAAARLCDKDDVPYEFGGLGLGRAFPHHITGDSLHVITPSYYDAFDHSPFSTELLLALAEKFIREGHLGGGEATDLLCIGISATDEIGHEYGPASHEAFDNVLRTDAMLGDFFRFLDSEIGLENCIIALSSDHGIAPIPEYIRSVKPGTPAGRVSNGMIKEQAARILKTVYGGKNKSTDLWVSRVIESEITLDSAAISASGADIHSVESVLKDSLVNLPYAAEVITRDEIFSGKALSEFGRRMERSYAPGRSGDVMIILKPYFICNGDTVGTNHGQPYPYDSHVPMIFAGMNILAGNYGVDAQPVDIAPTLAIILGCDPPPHCDGTAHGEIFKK
jgi:arylsulfatase A-like enzyme